MANYKVVDADQLETDLRNVASAIRSKRGSSATLAWPSGFRSEILAIETGADVSAVTATASDVVSGKKFVNSSGTVVTGTLAVQTYYYGSGDPAASLGVNGDLYFKMEG